MNHKRRRAPHQRAHCSMCKPHKDNRSANKRKLGLTGFSKIRKEVHALADIKELFR